MKVMTIITAKIEPNIYERIRQSTKTWEVRSEGFQGAQIIHYVCSETGKTLGYHRLGPTGTLQSKDRDLARVMSGVDEETFDRLLPPLRTKWYAVAQIGARVNIEDIFPREEMVTVDEGKGEPNNA